MKTFIVIPTYNEAAHIERLIKATLKQVLHVTIVVVDDHSPDGTWKKVGRLSRRYRGKVVLLLRTKSRGRGSAGIDGFTYALGHGAEVVVEMDADFSHHPRYLPTMLREIEFHDVVVGSRFVAGGKDTRGFYRRCITTLGNFYIRTVLGLRIRDCTSGYRVFRRTVLEAIRWDMLISSGPSIVQEILYKAGLLGFRIKEVPIVFVDRRQGNSKFNGKILLQGILMVLVLRFMASDVWKAEVTKNGST